MMKFTRNLTIFEGPDGAGKSTAAEDFAIATNAAYVHFPALGRVTKGLARMYVEAMLPALLGYQDVVFDRCWLSEVPYGKVFRGGQDRLGDASRAMLERLALRCNAVVIRCKPPQHVVIQNFQKRVELEYLENAEELTQVYGLYDNAFYQSSLPRLKYDYTDPDDAYEPLYERVVGFRGVPHRLDVRSAGCLSANWLLIGEDFGERKDQDPFYQWPFASFSGNGCSQWLTSLLLEHDIREDQLAWVNADQDLTAFHPKQKVIALGNKARIEASRHFDLVYDVPHPQHHKRFGGREDYALIDILTGKLK